MRFRPALLLFAFMVLSLSAKAADEVPSYIADEVSGAVLSGRAHVQYMMVDLYDAALYLPHDQDKIMPPFALSLTYLRDFNGVDIADRAIEDIRSQGYQDEIKLAAWHDRLADMIGEVGSGTTITGIFGANGQSRFYRDGAFIGKIDDPLFGKHFFDIWLGSPPNEPIELIRFTHPT